MMLSEYQKFLEDTSWYAHAGRMDAGELAYLTLGVAGEAGEFADAVKKLIRTSGFDQSTDGARDYFYEELGRRSPHLVEELGDVMWYLVRTCSFFNITPKELMVMNTVKLYARLLDKKIITKESTPWPFQDLPFEDALKLTQDIESRITGANASTSTDTDT